MVSPKNSPASTRSDVTQHKNVQTDAAHDGHSHDDDAHGHGHEHGEGRGSWFGALRHALSGFLGLHSHDPADSIDDALESSGRGIRAVIISFTVLIVTAGVQAGLVVLTGSVALLADTIHNFSDALTSVPLFIAFRLGRRAATRKYTYGFRRAEDLAGLFIVLMILLSAFVVAYESIDRMINPRDITYVGIVFWAGIIGFAGNELVALYRIRVGRSIGSAALVADGHHARVDGFTSLAVAAGATGVWLGFPMADPIVGVLVALAILGVLRTAARDIFGRLMDAVDPELVDTVEKIVASVPGVSGVGRCQVRWIGHRLRIDLELNVDGGLSVAEGHEISEIVRLELLDKVLHLDEVLIHIDSDTPHAPTTTAPDALTHTQP